LAIRGVGDTGYFRWIERQFIRGLPRPVFNYSYWFYPVGQGLFFSGSVSRAAGRPFDWVYDCGTSQRSNRKLVLRGLARLRRRVVSAKSDAHLDMVVLSHFDEDHVSGVQDLLRHFSVGTLLLPYLSPWDRLLVALSEDAQAGSDFLSFVLEPTAFLIGLGEGRIGRIVLVPPSGDSAHAPGPGLSPDGPEDTLGTAEDEDLGDLKFPTQGVPAEPDDAGGRDGGLNQPQVAVLADGGALILPHIWEFVPYNDPQNAHLVDDAFRALAAPLAETLRRARFNNDPDAVIDALEGLKALYATTFGSTSKKKNLISLYLYGGPVAPVVSMYEEERGFRGRSSSWRISWRHDEGADRVGHIMTGDGYLETTGRWNSFERFYGPHDRLFRTGCLQVMHHGSKWNWQPGVADRIRPNYAVFSSNPVGEYWHPHSVVLNDFARYGPRQVDARNGWSLAGGFVFR